MFRVARRVIPFSLLVCVLSIGALVFAQESKSDDSSNAASGSKASQDGQQSDPLKRPPDG
jgi:preprotein translocase subunit SecG